MTKPSTYFLRVKEDHLNEIAEDYVEEIHGLHQQTGEARATDLAERFGVSTAAVSKTISKLVQENLVESRPYRGIFLTSAGEKLAKKVAKRHDIVLQALLKLGVPYEIARGDSEGIEHHCSRETVAALARLIEDDSREIN